MHFPYFVITQPALVDVERAADLYAEAGRCARSAQSWEFPKLR
jgi:hypothetical protein